eukprot:16437499-Heterocapsa_arctica.AAC.2
MSLRVDHVRLTRAQRGSRSARHGRPCCCAELPRRSCGCRGYCRARDRLQSAQRSLPHIDAHNIAAPAPEQTNAVGVEAGSRQEHCASSAQRVAREKRDASRAFGLQSKSFSGCQDGGLHPGFRAVQAVTGWEKGLAMPVSMLT